MAQPRTVVIFGKDTWPYTEAAREAFAGKGYVVDYRNVKKSSADLEQMLAHTRRRREVPVIVEDGKVTIGYGGT